MANVSPEKEAIAAVVAPRARTASLDPTKPHFVQYEKGQLKSQKPGGIYSLYLKETVALQGVGPEAEDVRRVAVFGLQAPGLASKPAKDRGIVHQDCDAAVIIRGAQEGETTPIEDTLRQRGLKPACAKVVELLVPLENGQSQTLVPSGEKQAFVALG